MEYSHLLFLCLLCSLSAIGTSVLATDVETWKEVLPNTPIPKSLGNTMQTENQVDVSAAKDFLKSPSDDVASIFFTEKDLLSGKKIKLIFPKAATPAKFLPRNAAKSVPFSSEKFPQILKLFSISPESSEAKTMKQTIEECEEPGVKGEDKFCATSLKSMLDYSVSKIGKRVKIYTTDVIEGESAEKQAYTVDEKVGVKSIGDRSVVCHKQKYVYAVYLCHEVHAKAYEVSLVKADGAKAKGIAVCHADKESLKAQKFDLKTSKAEPGSAPFCHFLPSDDLVWMPN